MSAERRFRRPSSPPRPSRPPKPSFSPGSPGLRRAAAALLLCLPLLGFGGAAQAQTSHQVTVVLTGEAHSTQPYVSGFEQNSGVRNRYVKVQMNPPRNTETQVRLCLGGTATRPTDYEFKNADLTDPNNQIVSTGPGIDAMGCLTVEFAANSGEEAYAISIVGDGFVERDETVTFQVSGHSSTPGDVTFPAGASFTHTIINEDVPDIEIAGRQELVTEGAVASFTVTADQAPLDDLNVSLTVADAPGANFVAPENEGAGKTVTIPAGMTSATYMVQTVADSVDEPSGPVTVTVQSSTDYGGAGASATVSVKDDDGTNPVVSVSMSMGATDERDGDHRDYPIVLSLSQSVSERVNVLVCFTGTANVGDADFFPLLFGDRLPLTDPGPRQSCGVLFFSSGTTSRSNFTLRVYGDTKSEPHEDVVLTVRRHPGDTITTTTPIDVDLSPTPFTFTIRNDDPPGASVTTPAPEISESQVIGGSTRVNFVRFNLDLTVPAKERLQVAYTYISPGGEQSGALIIPKGDRSKTLWFKADVTRDGRRTHTFRLRPASSGRGDYVAISPLEAQVTVTDIDAATPTVNLSVSNSGEATEGGSALTITATRSEANTSGAPLIIPIRVKPSGTTAQPADYTVGASISIANNASSGTTTFMVTDDSVDEMDDETVVIELGTLPAGTVAGTDNEIRITIIDNDGGGTQIAQVVPKITIARTSSATLTEGGSATFTVSADPPPPSALTVNLTVADAPGADYVASGNESGQTVTIPASTASATYILPTAGGATEDTDEPNGPVTVTVAASTTNPATYTVDNPSSDTVTVNDDDPTAVELSLLDPSATEDSSTDPARISVRLRRGLRSGEILAVPLQFAGGTVNTDFTLALSGSPTGVTLSGSTVTFTGSAGGSATVASVELLASDDADTTDKTVTVSIPASSITGNPRLTATGLGGGATGSRVDNGQITLVDDDGDGGDTQPPTDPVLTLTGGSAVTEGTAARFTVTASPVPAGPLAVSISVEDAPGANFLAADVEGNDIWTFEGGAATRTFTIPTQADSIVEPSGPVTVTLRLHTSGGYTLGNSASDTVTVNDDDDTPPPAPAAAAVASFAQTSGSAAENAGTVDVTVTLTPAPASLLTLRYTVGGTATPGRDHDFTITNSGTVDVAAGTSRVAIPVLITDDDKTEPAETVILTLTGGPGYTIGSPRTHTLTIDDDDTAGVELSVSALRLEEEGDTARYTVRLLSQPATPVTVTIISSAPARTTVTPQRLQFDAATWQRPQTVTVTAGTPGGAALTHQVASADPNYNTATLTRTLRVRVGEDLAGVAGAGAVRFARTHVGHVLDSIAGRLTGAAAPGAQARVAGQAIELGSPAAGLDAGAARPAGGRDDPARGARADTRALTTREVLAGTSFALTGEPGADGAVWSVWGRGAWARFDGRQAGVDARALAVDGEMTLGTLGVDRRWGRWLTGLALSHSLGDGTYDGAAAGTLESSMTMVTPWAAYAVTDRLRAWGALGYGQGRLTLTPEKGRALKADAATTMAAAGARGAVIAAPAAGGFSLAVTTDALWLRATSDQAGDGLELGASASQVSRLRLGLEGAWRHVFEEAGTLGTRLALGGRHDGGDAETGFGVELGGGVSWTNPAHGLTLRIDGRGLLAHDAAGFQDTGASAALGWAQDPATQRGPSLALRQEWGGAAAGGLDRLLTPETPGGAYSPSQAPRLTAEAAYGFPTFDGRFTGSPHLGYGVAGPARDYTVGWRLAPAGPGASDLSLGLLATRRESARVPATHQLGIELRGRW